MSICGGVGVENTLNLARILLENVIYNYILQLESLGPGSGKQMIPGPSVRVS